MTGSLFFILTHTWGIDILFEKLTPEKQGDEFEKHPFCTNMSLRVGISWKASVLWVSELTKVKGNYVCCLAIVVVFVLAGGAKRYGFFTVIIRREGKKPQTRGIFKRRHKKTTQGVDH